jgi:hypothetical protein
MMIGKIALAATAALLAQHGVSATIQRSLASKLARGGTLDASNPANMPVKSEQHVTPGAIETWETYADGSIVVVGVERPRSITTHNADGSVTQASMASPQASVGIQGCSVQSYSVTVIYSGCDVWYQDATWVLFSFVTGWSINRSSPDVINGKGTANQNTCITSCTTPTNFAYKATENSSGTAYDSWSVEWNFAGVESSTRIVTLQVGSDSYSAHT